MISRTLDAIKVLIGGLILAVIGRSLLEATIANYKINSDVIAPSILVGVIAMFMFTGGVISIMAALRELFKSYQSFKNRKGANQ